MADYSLVPVNYQPDFEHVSLVPVDYNPFADSGTIQQAPMQPAQIPIQSPQTQPQVQQAQFQSSQTQPQQVQPEAQAQPRYSQDRIADHAIGHVGSEKWADEVAKGPYAADSNKCNLFVYDVLTGAGASPGYPNGSGLLSYPPTAGQWADPNFPIRGWRVLGPEESPKAGDVVAQKIEYTDATGHVMIVGPDGNSFIGTGTSAGHPHGTIVNIPWRDNLGPAGASHGPLVFRRFGE